MRILTRELHVDRQRLLAALAWAAPYLAALFILALPRSLGEPALPGADFVGARWVGGPLDGQAVNFGALILPDGHGQFRVVFNVTPQLRSSGPLGLRLAGPFSAQAEWNGIRIGGKGEPGLNSAQEQPGPIDSVVPIPAPLVRDGENVLLLTMSNHRVGRRTAIIHGSEGLSVGPYAGDARRPLGHYLMPLVMIGVLVLALITLAQRKGTRWVVLFVAALLAAAAIEISRSFVNYPYPLHALRTGALSAACALGALAMAMVAAEAAGAMARWREMAATIAAAWVFAWLASMPSDPRAAFVIAAGAIIGLCYAVTGALERRAGCMQLALALGLILVLALLDSRDFFDRAYYAASLPLIAQFAHRRREAPKSAPTLDRLAIGAAKRRRIAPVAEIKAVHGAGKYCEFELAGGERVLDERTLTQVAHLLPAQFFRAHRSHIVNLAFVNSILTLGAGRYAIEMAGEARVPLSRDRVAHLRERFERESTCALSATAPTD